MLLEFIISALELQFIVAVPSVISGTFFDYETRFQNAHEESCFP